MMIIVPYLQSSTIRPIRRRKDIRPLTANQILAEIILRDYDGDIYVPRSLPQDTIDELRTKWNRGKIIVA